jgi:hypothetical protein
VDIGGEYAGFSVDAYYSKVNDSISASALSAADVADLPKLGFSPNNSLAATISDNTAFAIMGLYNLGVVKFFAAYEHIQYANPTHPLDIGGYKLACVNMYQRVRLAYHRYHDDGRPSIQVLIGGKFQPRDP